MFSNLYRYFTIEIITEKYIGSRPVSDITAKFEEYYSIQRYILENLIAICQSYYLYI